MLVTLSARSLEEGAGRDQVAAMLPKAVSDALYMAGKKCVLLR